MDTLKPISKETFVEGLPIFDTYLKSLEPKETSTNETLEEIALKLSEQFEENKDGFEERSDFYYGVIAGYKHCEKTMKAQYDELYALYVEATRN